MAPEGSGVCGRCRTFQVPHPAHRHVPDHSGRANPGQDLEETPAVATIMGLAGASRSTVGGLRRSTNANTGRGLRRGEVILEVGAGGNVSRPPGQP
eukprot:1856529-Pyramimonas_sp.AAC.1